MRVNPAMALTIVATVQLNFYPERTLAQDVQRVKYTVHNLSVSGPGAIRAASETEVCVFCHTPHGSSGVRPLWNRRRPEGPYQIYQSTSLEAQVGQPTGASKLCLSCHDGTIALGSVLSRPLPIAMLGTSGRLPHGPSNLGTDLSDDHPISFPHNASFVGGDTELLAARAITAPVILDENGEVQCTSCHEPHDNTHGKFLLRSNEAGALCTSCHRPLSWFDSAHATSSKTVSSTASEILSTGPTTVSRSACDACHSTHGAPGRSWLLDGENISATCITCHDGSVATSDLQREISKPFNHGIVTEGPSGIAGGPYIEGVHVSCSDCHDAHAAGSTAGLSANVPSSLAGVGGIRLNGTPIPIIQHVHELCFRCHGDAPARVRPLVSRVSPQPNKRFQFQRTNPSFHPVGNPGVNSMVPSLVPPLTTSDLIACGDCHSSDADRAFGGGAPSGPHGSIHEGLLVQRYDTVDFAVESASAYALCYRCHQRDSILRDESFKSHRKHIVEERSPCSVCHDPHGISWAQGSSRNHSHLINFDRAVVFSNSVGRLEFVDLGTFRGECYLQCHGVDHNPLAY